MGPTRARLRWGERERTHEARGVWRRKEEQKEEQKKGRAPQDASAGQPPTAATLSVVTRVRGGAARVTDIESTKSDACLRPPACSPQSSTCAPTPRHPFFASPSPRPPHDGVRSAGGASAANATRPSSPLHATPSRIPPSAYTPPCVVAGTASSDARRPFSHSSKSVASLSLAGLRITSSLRPLGDGTTSEAPRASKPKGGARPGEGENTLQNVLCLFSSTLRWLHCSSTSPVAPSNDAFDSDGASSRYEISEAASAASPAGCSGTADAMARTRREETDAAAAWRSVVRSMRQTR